MRFWKQDKDIGGVETSLRSQRPRLDRSLESDLMSRISSRPAPRSGYRLVLATGLTVALASFGGVSYAVSAAKQAVSGGTNTSSTVTNSSTGQYGEGTCVEYVNPH